MKKNQMQNKNGFFIHDSSYNDEGSKIGKGTKVWHFSHIQSNSTIGENCTLGQNVNVANNVIIGNYVKIQNNVSIYEGVELEDFVFCGPSMVFTNIKVPRSEFPQRGTQNYIKTLIKKSASIGANATIICGLTVGKYALIGSGAVVTKNVPDYALIIGNPGRIVGWVDKLGKRLKFGINNVSSCGNFKLNGSILSEL